jgi:hypothetical protein
MNPGGDHGRHAKDRGNGLRQDHIGAGRVLDLLVQGLRTDAAAAGQAASAKGVLPCLADRPGHGRGLSRRAFDEHAT